MAPSTDVANFDAAATAAGWAQNADGSWSPTAAGQTLAYGGVTYQNFETHADLSADPNCSTCTNFVTPVVCFAKGTLIVTKRGEVPVEQLALGDEVLTMDNGFKPIKWIGRRELRHGLLQAFKNLRPIRILAGSLGGGLPWRDLVVSAQHRVLVHSAIAQRIFGTREVLVAAKHLLELPGVEIIEDAIGVEYWHFMLDQHEVVFAEGAPSESLYAGTETLKSLSSAARAELLTLFPELTNHSCQKANPARMLISGAMGRKIARRHLINSKDLLSPGWALTRCQAPT
ncbi:MAG: Hint domain-containing protein [Paracoccaceae bacterium]|nr:Hint domain-containing protein [Paracoccaceae bacterium]